VRSRPPREYKERNKHYYPASQAAKEIKSARPHEGGDKKEPALRSPNRERLVEGFVNGIRLGHRRLHRRRKALFTERATP
jgi:hypothetical protein